MSNNSVSLQNKRRSSLQILVSKLRQLKATPPQSFSTSPILDTSAPQQPLKPPRITIEDDLLRFQREGFFIPRVWHSRSVAVTDVSLVGELDVEFKLHVLHGLGPTFEISVQLVRNQPWALESCTVTCTDFSFVDPKYVDVMQGVLVLPMLTEGVPGWLPHYSISVLIFLILSTLQINPHCDLKFQRPMLCPFPHRGLVCKTGEVSLQGRRPTMEDHMLIQPPWQDIQLFGVFDGHGGGNTALRLSQKLPLLFDGYMADMDVKNGRELGIAKSLKCAIDAFDREICQNTTEPSGSTACVAAVDLKTMCITVANVGDTRCVLCRQGQALDLSIDHKADHPHEVARMVRNGGFVSRGRAMGVLAVSRAVGDRDLKRIGNTTTPIVCDADVDSVALNPYTDEFMLIACDGLFDVMSSQEVVAFARSRFAEGLTAEEVGLALGEHAIDELGSMDNVSILVVEFAFAPQGPLPSLRAQAQKCEEDMLTPLKSSGSSSVLRAARASAMKRASSAQKRTPQPEFVNRVIEF